MLRIMESAIELGTIEDFIIIINFWQAFFVVAKGYAMTPPVPRLKLVSTQDLKPFLNVEDIKLEPWSDQM